jgi:hypothetical protein
LASALRLTLLVIVETGRSALRLNESRRGRPQTRTTVIVNVSIETLTVIDRASIAKARRIAPPPASDQA